MADAVTSALRLAGLGGGKAHIGPIISTVRGRHDEHPMDVPAESFVLPADVVSAMGEGNSLAGMKAVEARFGRPAPSAAKAVPIVAAGGEIVLTPEQVARYGGGDIKRGHERLRQFVLDIRKKHIKTLRSLPKPAR